jgi:L-serine dehydratase
MDMFRIIGPVMIGPSSSHTAGAVRIGKMARIILGENPEDLSIELHQSYAKTSKGHGTKLAIVAGLIGFSPDDERIRNSFTWAERKNFTFTFVEKDLGNVHPNSVRFLAKKNNGQPSSLLASSIGGGRIRIKEVNGLSVDFSGDRSALICLHQDKLGLVAELTYILAGAQINIANMKVFRSARMGQVATFIETDQTVSGSELNRIRSLDGVDWAAFIAPLIE